MRPTAMCMFCTVPHAIECTCLISNCACACHSPALVRDHLHPPMLLQGTNALLGLLAAAAGNAAREELGENLWVARACCGCAVHMLPEWVGCACLSACAGVPHSRQDAHPAQC